MNAPNSTERYLRALQQAAARGDVNRCWDVTHKVLRQLPWPQALRLVRDFVARRLPTFERHQPGIRWPRHFIESISEDNTGANVSNWPEIEDDFPGPGANNFTNAVEALWKASLAHEDDLRPWELLADAIAGAIMAERLEHWGSRNPDAWARWYQLASSDSTDTSRFEVLASIQRDPEASRIESSAWLEVTQCLAAALNSFDGS